MKFDLRTRVDEIGKRFSPIVIVPQKLAEYIEGHQKGDSSTPHLSTIGGEWDGSQTREVLTTSLLYYLKSRPNDPCYCGSNHKYKNCHAEEDLRKLEEKLSIIKGKRFSIVDRIRTSLE